MPRIACHGMPRPTHMAWRAVQVAQAPVQGHEVLCMLKKKAASQRGCRRAVRRCELDTPVRPNGGKRCRVRRSFPHCRGDSLWIREGLGNGVRVARPLRVRPGRAVEAVALGGRGYTPYAFRPSSRRRTLAVRWYWWRDGAPTRDGGCGMRPTARRASTDRRAEPAGKRQPTPGRPDYLIATSFSMAYSGFALALAADRCGR
jgi:hypothetical protein